MIVLNNPLIQTREVYGGGGRRFNVGGVLALNDPPCHDPSVVTWKKNCTAIRSDSTRNTVLYRRTLLKLKAKLEIGSSYFSFKR